MIDLDEIEARARKASDNEPSIQIEDHLSKCPPYQDTDPQSVRSFFYDSLDFVPTLCRELRAAREVCALAQAIRNASVRKVAGGAMLALDERLKEWHQSREEQGMATAATPEREKR